MKRVLAAIAIAASCLAAPRLLHAQSPSLWELTSYRVHVYIVPAEVPQISPQLRQDLQDILTDRIDSLVGASWDATVEPAPQMLSLAAVGGLGSVSIDKLPPETLKADKVMIVRLDWSYGGYVVEARELDLHTRLWGTAIRTIVGQPARLSDAALDAMFAAFAPLARVEGVKDSQVSLRLRGGQIPPRDLGLTFVAPHTIFRPVVRFNDRDGEILADKPPTPINWTYLRADTVDAGVVTCQIFTGLRSPLTARRRGRTEQLALAVHPPDAPTELVLSSRTDSSRRLFGYEVVGYDPSGKESAVLGQTDRDGKLTVLPAPFGLRVLVIKSGGELLARLPLVPGVEPVALASVSDDDQRLAVEGYITGLQEEVVDLVARRGTLMARIRAHIAADRLKEAGELLVELRQLATRDDLDIVLSEQRKQYFSGDASIRRKIDKLFDDTRQVLMRNLDPKQIEEVKAEVDQAARAAPAAASAGTAPASPTSG